MTQHYYYDGGIKRVQANEALQPDVVRVSVMVSVRGSGALVEPLGREEGS